MQELDLPESLISLINDKRAKLDTIKIKELEKENTELKNIISTNLTKCQICTKYKKHPDIDEYMSYCEGKVYVCLKCLKTSSDVYIHKCTVCRRRFYCNDDCYGDCYDYCEKCDCLYCNSCGRKDLCGKCSFGL